MTTTNTYGRQVVVPLTNKSGGGVIAGDVVVVGTANNDAFTTTNSAGFTGTVGVAQETIADNATGRVLISGYAALINTTASVTRQNFGTTSTTVKKAVDAGSSRTVGTFCQFLTGGTTPDAIVYPADLGSGAGSIATDAIWDAAGDLVQGTGANTSAKLSAGSTSQVLTSAGAAAANVWAYPRGYEIDYVEKTSATTINGTSEATANIIVTSNATAFDGTACWFEFYSPQVATPAGVFLYIVLFDNTASTSAGIGRLALWKLASGEVGPSYGKRKLTPAAGTRTFSVRGYVDSSSGSVNAGPGGTTDYMPTFLRITKA